MKTEYLGKRGSDLFATYMEMSVFKLYIITTKDNLTINLFLFSSNFIQRQFEINSANLGALFFKHLQKINVEIYKVSKHINVIKNNAKQ